ncbi:MAG: VWA domain-containing protein [Thermogutta sp.]
MLKKHLIPDSPVDERRAAIVLLAAIMLTAIVGLLALSLDVGYMVLVRSQLQAAADSAALAGAGCLVKGPEAVFLTADRFARYHTSSGYQLSLLREDVELGFWDATVREFSPDEQGINAVRVCVRRSAATGNPAPLFFARALGKATVDLSAQAVAATIPRDIVFVVDVSESMNDETEPAWATELLDQMLGHDQAVGTQLAQRVYHDFGFGDYPGPLEYIGQPWGVPTDERAYAKLASDKGPLSKPSVPGRYRIHPSDDAATRKIKVYSAIIDYQIARLMPNAKPTPSSQHNYAYWEKYLDYLIKVTPSQNPGPPDPPRLKPPVVPPLEKIPPGRKTSPLLAIAMDTRGKSPGRSSSSLETDTRGKSQSHSSSSAENNARGSTQGRSASPPQNNGRKTPPRTPSETPHGHPPQTPPGNGKKPPKSRPSRPGRRLPRDSTSGTADHIWDMHNPNQDAFPEASPQLPMKYVNRIGYLTYIQFMMDYGRDLKPDGVNNVPLSQESPYCTYHTETTSGGSFRFPPREEPLHSIRRSLIETIHLLKQRNESLPMDRRDWVAIAAFDTPIGGTVRVIQPLTPNYDQAMAVCTQLQAGGDKGLTTNLEAGLIAARDHLQPSAQGGAGRRYAHKVVILLTDGHPNCCVSSPKTIQDFLSESVDSSDVSSWSQAQLAALMQALRCYQDGWTFYPVGVGMGVEREFINKLAACSQPGANDESFDQVADHPVGRVEKIVEILRRIIDHPPIRLVQ